VLPADDQPRFAAIADASQRIGGGRWRREEGDMKPAQPRPSPMPTLPSGTADACSTRCRTRSSWSRPTTIANANRGGSLLQTSLPASPPPPARAGTVGSPLLALIDQVRARGTGGEQYKVDLSTPRNQRAFGRPARAPLPERADHVVSDAAERTIAER
jgi:hypothetical protein